MQCEQRWQLFKSSHDRSLCMESLYSGWVAAGESGFPTGSHGFDHTMTVILSYLRHLPS